MAGSPIQRPGGIRLFRTFHAFQDPNYRFLWPANVSTNVSRFVQTTVMAWFVLDLTDSPLLVALVGFSMAAPMLLFGLTGGVLADTLNRRVLLLSSQAASLGISLVMLGLLVTKSAEYWHAYVLMLVIGTSFAMEMPARRSLIHDLLGRSGVTNAFALDSVGQSASRMAGPALAGGLITVAGVQGGYYVVAALYMASFALLWRLQEVKRTRSGPVAIKTVAANMARGLRYVGKDPILRAVVAVTVLMNVALFPYQHMVPVMARDVLNVGPGLMGVLLAVDGLGAMIGAVAIASAPNIRYHGRLYVGGTVLALSALLLFAMSSGYLVSLAVLFVLGIGAGVFSSIQGAMVVLVAPEQQRGRALGVISLAIGTGPFGALLVGVVANVKGPAFALGLNAAAGLAIAAVVALLMPAIRRPILADAR